MSDTTTYIFTLIYNSKQLVKVAVTIDDGAVEDEDIECFMEPECQKALFNLLPFWFQVDDVNIVAIEQISEHVFITNKQLT